jgi:hypothetical protein
MLSSFDGSDSGLLCKVLPLLGFGKIIGFSKQFELSST